MCDIQSILDWMDRRGISQTELARRLRRDRSGLNRILKGKAPLHPSLAERIDEIMQADEDSISVKLSDADTAIVKQLAAQEGVTPNEWIEARVAQYMRDLRAAGIVRTNSPRPE